jgi:hypothetical protein
MKIKLDGVFEVCKRISTGRFLEIRYLERRLNIKYFGSSLDDIGDLFLEKEDACNTGTYSVNSGEDFTRDSGFCMVVSKDLKEQFWMSNPSGLQNGLFSHRPKYKNNKWKAKKTCEIHEAESSVQWTLCRNQFGEFFLYDEGK